MNEWTTLDIEYGTLLKRMVRLAAQSGYTLNTDKERIAKVVGLMTNNLVAAGKPYCPCKQSHPLDPHNDVVCPCLEWREEISKDGHCFCRLFYGKSASEKMRRSPRKAAKKRKHTRKEAAMPRSDGTGPSGKGSGTGRGRGPCGGGQRKGPLAGAGKGQGRGRKGRGRGRGR
jgi:ferredoxin-thioredoxin reductase catalytic subunit